MTVLTTQRLILRPQATTDFDFLTDLWQRADFCHQIGFEPMAREQIWMRLLRDMGHWQHFGYGNFTVFKQDETPIGVCGLFDYQRDIAPKIEVPEAGWGLHPEFHHQGFGFEMLKATLDFGDATLKPKSYVALISPDNRSSRNLAEKSGFSLSSEVVFKEKPTLWYERKNAR